MGVKVKKYKGSWYIFINHQGQRKAKKVGTKEGAERVKREIEARLALGDFSCLNNCPPVPTFAEYAERWLEVDAPTRCKTSTIDFYRDYQARYILPELGAIPLTDITRDAVKDLVLKLSNRGLARNTIRLAIASLRVVLSSAVEDSVIPTNPAIRLGRFVKTEKPEQKAKAMTPEEVQKFLAAARTYCAEYYPLFLIALRAGLRQGEILGLKYGDFHFGEGGDDPDRYIFVQRRWYRGDFSTPKGKKERRVDMSQELRQTLLQLYEDRECEAVREGRKSIDDDLVFPGENGKPLRARKLLETYFGPMLRKAGLGHFRFHDLRHTFGSLLIEAGAPLPYVRDQMGHSSIQVTADKYVHLMSRRNVRFIDRLDTSKTAQPDATQAQPELAGHPRSRTSNVSQVTENKGWCERGDSNPHPLRDQILSLARLPVPPLSQSFIIIEAACFGRR
jgi:integrase